MNRRSFLRKATASGCCLTVGKAIADEFDRESHDADGYPAGYAEYKKHLDNLNARYGAVVRDPSVKVDCPFAWRTTDGGPLDMESVTAGTYPDRYPKGAIIHVTEGRFASNENMEATIADGKRNHYTYMGIARKGKIYQTHSLERSGYHAGKSFYPGLGQNVAVFLLGIEMAAAGTLRRNETGGFEKVWNEGDKTHPPIKSAIEDSQVRQGKVQIPEDREPKGNPQKQGYYHILSAEQEWALTRLLLWLQQNNPKIFKLKYVLGHDEVAPKRKTDPGSGLSLSLNDFRLFLENPASKQYIERYQENYRERIGFRDNAPLVPCIAKFWKP